MKLLLTSTGFSNPKLGQRFLRMAGKPAAEIRALFIPTAAIEPDAIDMLPACLGDLRGLGIPDAHIRVCDLHQPVTAAELDDIDAVYVCGGSTAYLLQRVNEAGFGEALRTFLARGGVYVGVSAGSVIAAQNLPHNLGYVPCQLNVHCAQGSPDGPLGERTAIDLTNEQAIVIDGASVAIVS